MAPRKPNQPKRYLCNKTKKNNPEYQRYRRGRRMKWLNLYKTGKGCELCGYNKNGVALDFDHLDPSIKEFNPSSRSLTVSLKRLFIEIRKCRILCANCHRIETQKLYITGGGYCGT